MIPVLTVSVKTCDQSGFSRNRVTRPLSSVTTKPIPIGSERCAKADRDQGALLMVGGEQGREVDVGQRIAGHHQERLIADPALGELHAACGAHGPGFGGIPTRYRDPPVTEVGADHLSQVMHRDDGVGGTVTPQQQQQVLQQRSPGQRQQRLGNWGRQRPQSGA